MSRCRGGQISGVPPTNTDGTRGLGKTTRNTIRKGTESRTTKFLGSNYSELRSHSARTSPPDQGSQNVGIASASSNFIVMIINNFSFFFLFSPLSFGEYENVDFQKGAE